MTARLHITSLSHPSKAAAMVAHKRLPQRRIELRSGPYFEVPGA